MKKTLVLSLAVLAFCMQQSIAGEKLKVGATPVPHADILKFVQPQLQKEGVDLVLIEFSDYVQPNLALADKDLDANFFQHKPYLESFAGERKLKLVSAGAVHIEPMGVYSSKYKNLDLKKGSKIGIPNDPTNGGRALKVLEAAGLLKMDPKVGIKGTPLDIIENPKNIRIVEVEAASLPRALVDLDAAVINSNFALSGNLNPVKDSLVMEQKDSPYANIVAVRQGDESKESIQKLMKVLRSEGTRKFIMDKYQGAVVPAF